MIDLDRQLEWWIDEGIITGDQARSMRRSVLGPVPPPEQLPSGEEGRIPVIAEILGYVGVVLATWAVVFVVSEFWGNLSDWSQAGLFGSLAMLLFIAGAVLLDSTEPALRRLSSVLWAGSVLALGGGLFIVFDPILGYSAAATSTLTGAVGVVAGGLMLRRQESVAQHVVVFAAAMATVMSVLNLGPDPELFVYGFVAWAVGLIWILVTRAGVLRPRSPGMEDPSSQLGLAVLSAPPKGDAALDVVRAFTVTDLHHAQVVEGRKRSCARWTATKQQPDSKARNDNGWTERHERLRNARTTAPAGRNTSAPTVGCCR